MNRLTQILLLLALSALMARPVFADGISFTFTTGAPNGSMAIASRPGNGSLPEIEAADDFVFAAPASITSATFTGLVPSGASIDQVVVEIYRVFPNDSTVPPDGRVPTRMNSPSDVAFDSRSSGSGLSFTTTTLSNSFKADNSVLNGIFPKPNQNTKGEGPVTGQEVQFNVSFLKPFNLPADHFFFVPQVGLSNGDFFWLSAARPNVIDPFTPDLQAWVRNGPLDPDWLRVGTDIVGGDPAPTFNASFSITAVSTPESSSAVLLIVGLVGCALLGWKTNRAL
jgi:hypothetical protein